MAVDNRSITNSFLAVIAGALIALASKVHDLVEILIPILERL